MWQFLTDRGVGIAIWFVAMAAQMSGYNNTAIALGLIGFAAFFALAPVCHHAHAWHRRRLMAGRRNVELWQISVFSGLAIILLGLVVVGVSFLYGRSQLAAERTPITIVNAAPNVPPLPASNTQPPMPVPPNNLLPANLASRVGRYIKLKELLTEMQMRRKAAEFSGEGVLNNLKPLGPRIGAGGSGTMGVRWRENIVALKAIAGNAYSNRDIDIQSVHQLVENPHLKAPGDEVFPDQASAWPYVQFYYLRENVLKQVDALIVEMERELQALRIELKNTPEAKSVLAD